MKNIICLCVLLLGLGSTRASGQTVYASDKGEKYHTADCNLSGDARDMRLATAKKGGKKPCAYASRRIISRTRPSAAPAKPPTVRGAKG